MNLCFRGEDTGRVESSCLSGRGQEAECFQDGWWWKLSYQVNLVLEGFFPWGLGAFFVYLLLCDKLLQNLGASNNNCVIISHNSVGQEFEQGTEGKFISIPCGACRRLGHPRCK